MSSRAFRRLNQDSDIIKLPAIQGKERDEDDDDDGIYRPSLKEGREINLFEVLQGDDEKDDDQIEGDIDNDDGHGSVCSPSTTNVSSKSSHTKKKRKKKKKQKQQPATINTEGVDEVDLAIKEVTEMLGGLDTKGPDDITSEETQIVKSLLCVNRRFLNADNEMRKIFGSRVIRAERSEKKDHKKRAHRQSIFVTPKDTWPAIEKLGISMHLVETSNNCQHFIIEHSPEYQRVQFSFLDAVNTYDPNAIGAVLHAHPFHVDSLIQLSEVCKMGDDSQMAAELIERAVYQFECCFHPLFNVTQDNCRLSYTRTENRSFFLALFKHLNYVERKGCHQTAFELCKLLLSLDPDSDPLCILLMIDYHALRAYEYQFLIDFQRQWEAKRNLSQLPNFALSVPLAKFLLSTESSDSPTDDSFTKSDLIEEANKGIREALIMFPMFLLAILDKCSATLSSVVMNHVIFSSNEKCSNSLQLLIKVYIERTYSLWKATEVLEWLGSNALVVTQRADNGDPLVQDCRINRLKRYVGTPRNICRHVLLSDLESTMSTLPQDITATPIMMYDPLPPENSTAGYTRPTQSRTEGDDSQRHSNPFLLFLQSMLPSFNATNGPDGPQQPQLLGMPQQALHQLPQGAGAEGGNNTERVTLENAIQQLTTSLRGLLDQLQPRAPNDNNNDSNSDED